MGSIQNIELGSYNYFGDHQKYINLIEQAQKITIRKRREEGENQLLSRFEIVKLHLLVRSTAGPPDSAV